jgi:predicted DNA-binding transcriptional regulator AlpA
VQEATTSAVVRSIGSQPERNGAGRQPAAPQIPSHSAIVLPFLLTDKQAADLWGIGLTLFHELRAGRPAWFPKAIQLSPRVVRYSRAEVEAAIANMPRQADPSEPAQLRRARIERLKGGGAAA